MQTKRERSPGSKTALFTQLRGLSIMFQPTALALRLKGLVEFTGKLMEAPIDLYFKMQQAVSNMI